MKNFFKVTIPIENDFTNHNSVSLAQVHNISNFFCEKGGVGKVNILNFGFCLGSLAQAPGTKDQELLLVITYRLLLVMITMIQGPWIFHQSQLRPVPALNPWLKVHGSWSLQKVSRISNLGP